MKTLALLCVLCIGCRPEPQEPRGILVPLKFDGVGRIVMVQDTIHIAVSDPRARVYLLPVHVQLYPVSNDWAQAAFSADSVLVYQDGYAYKLVDPPPEVRQ